MNIQKLSGTEKKQFRSFISVAEWNEKCDMRLDKDQIEIVDRDLRYGGWQTAGDTYVRVGAGGAKTNVHEPSMLMILSRFGGRGKENGYAWDDACDPMENQIASILNQEQWPWPERFVISEVDGMRDASEEMLQTVEFTARLFAISIRLPFGNRVEFDLTVRRKKTQVELPMWLIKLAMEVTEATGSKDEPGKLKIPVAGLLGAFAGSAEPNSVAKMSLMAWMDTSSGALPEVHTQR